MILTLTLTLTQTLTLTLTLALTLGVVRGSKWKNWKVRKAAEGGGSPAVGAYETNCSSTLCTWSGVGVGVG